MTTRIQNFAMTALVSVAAAVLGPTAGAAETVTFNAFSVVQAGAQTFRTASDSATVIGVLRGPLYVEGDEGPSRTGSIVCPVTVEVSLETSRQVGHGRCTITTKDDALAFGSFECNGFHMVGCSGEFKLEGGTGRLEGVTGGGPVTLRGERWVLSSQGNSEVTERAAGIMFWRGFEVTMP